MSDLSVFVNARVNDEERFTHTVVVHAIMQDFFDNRMRGSHKQCDQYLTYAEGFTLEEILIDISCELSVKWFMKYGVDEHENTHGVITRIDVEECD